MSSQLATLPTHVQNSFREFEEGIIASTLIDASTIDRTSLLVSPTDFSDKALGQLFGLMADMRNAGEPVDLKTVYAKAKAIRFEGEILISRVGGLAALGRFATQAAHPAHGVYYAEQVRRASRKRLLAKLAAELASDAADWNVDPEDSIARFEAKSNTISANSEQIVSLRDASQSALALVQSRRNARITKTEDDQIGPSRVVFGLPCLDAGVGGLYGGDLIVIAARPSIGKTAFACQVAAYNAMQDRRSLIVSIEMSAEDIAMRSMAAELGVEVRAVRSGNVSESDIQSVKTWIEDVSNHNLLLWSARDVSASQIRSTGRLAKATHKIQMIVIDYLNLIRPENTKIDRHIQVGQITRDLKTMAMELKVPVVLLCQLGRGAEGTVPTIKDLKESGSIEQDADVILLMHRQDRKASKCDIEIAKVRNGATGDVSLEFHGPSTTFKDTSF